MTEQPFYTVPELAERWGVSTRFVRRLVAEHRIGVTRLGAHVRFASRDVRAFEDGGRQEREPVHSLLSKR
jgi:excisionase family DNA binding protein